MKERFLDVCYLKKHKDILKKENIRDKGNFLFKFKFNTIWIKNVDSIFVDSPAVGVAFVYIPTADETGRGGRGGVAL